MPILNGFSESSIEQAAHLLKQGEVVAFPTETVYGLGADALSKSAVEKIFQIKGRPHYDPLIVHIAYMSQLKDLTLQVSDLAMALIQDFWPGPLTLIFKKSHQIPDNVTSGLDTVAIRMPKHPVAKNLLKKCGLPLAAPSANKFQSISPTTAQDVKKELGEILILDGGPCEMGLESTVIDVSQTDPKILRLGALNIADIQRVLGFEPYIAAGTARETFESQMAPGMLSFHYAPKTKLILLESLNQMQNFPADSVFLVFGDYERRRLASMGYDRVLVLSSKNDFKEAAQNFYSQLREADELKPECIIAIKVPNEDLGLAINDRLLKAQHG